MTVLTGNSSFFSEGLGGEIKGVFSVAENIAKILPKSVKSGEKAVKEQEAAAIGHVAVFPFEAIASIEDITTISLILNQALENSKIISAKDMKTAGIAGFIAVEREEGEHDRNSMIFIMPKEFAVTKKDLKTLLPEVAKLKKMTLENWQADGKIVSLTNYTSKKPFSKKREAEEHMNLLKRIMNYHNIEFGGNEISAIESGEGFKISLPQKLISLIREKEE